MAENEATTTLAKVLVGFLLEQSSGKGKPTLLAASYVAKLNVI